jgi:hypothetical protein
MDRLVYRQPWGLEGHPPRVTVAGATFSRAFFAYPYDGVVAQYREERDRGAAHLLVYQDGTYALHRDATNPDRGPLLAIEHVWCDVPGGPLYVTAGGAALALAVGAGLAALLDSTPAPRLPARRALARKGIRRGNRVRRSRYV